MKPKRLGIDPSSPDVDKTYKHWYRTFFNFVDSLSFSEGNTEGSSPKTQVKKFNLLINYIESSVYEFIFECLSTKRLQKHWSQYILNRRMLL